jgi:hypothetical protein
MYMHCYAFFILSIAQLTRVNSTNVLDEGLRIEGIGRRMNSKVKVSQTRRILRIDMVVNLAYSQSVCSALPFKKAELLC